MDVSATIQGLLAVTTYSYRVAAVNNEAVTAGPIQHFTTAPGQEAPGALGTTRLLTIHSGSYRWRIAGTETWHTANDAVAVLPGQYLVEFEPTRADLPAPLSQTILIAAGSGAEVRDDRVVLPSGAAGNLVVTIEPDVVATALSRQQREQWRFLGETGEDSWRNGGLAPVALAPGSYRIEFRLIDGKVGVTSRTIVIESGRTRQVRVFYEDETTPGNSATQPQRLSANSVDDSPYCYSGQFLTDAGSGSGTVVKDKVVLTAGHVVFDKVTLTFTTGVQWIFQRYRGTEESPALTPRGSYVFDSYSKLRSKARSTVGIGQATQSSQQRDAAAVYFAKEAGRHGYTDVLSTGTTTATDWLTNNYANNSGPRLKTVVSYPVDLNFLNALNGFSEADAGKIFFTAPKPVVFTKRAAEALPSDVPEDGQTATSFVYESDKLAGYAGGSGGGVWVQYDDGTYYPAGIYLGGSDKCVVRAIDARVVDLVSRADAASQSASDPNNTGGGIARVTSQISNASYASARVKVTFTGLPLSKLGLARWTIGADATKRDASGEANTVPGSYDLHFLPVSGYRSPGILTIKVAAKDDVQVEGQYVELVGPTITTKALPRAVAGLAYGAVRILTSGPRADFSVASNLPAVAGQADAASITKFGVLAINSASAPVGTYEVSVTARNASNAQLSMTRKFALEIVPTGTLSVKHRNVTNGTSPVDFTGIGDGTFTKPVNDVMTLKAEAKPGFLFKQWNGFGITQVPSAGSTLTFTMGPAVSLFAEYVENPFVSAAGTYTGLFRETPARFAMTGSAKVTINANGTFTGKVLVAGYTYPLSGLFKVDGSYHGTVVRRSQPSFDLDLNFTPFASNRVLQGRIGGALTSGVAFAFTGQVPASFAATRACSLVLPPDPAQTALTYPQGNGVATLSVTSTGRVAGTVYLADGARGTVSGYATGSSSMASIALFVPLYRGKGSLSGTLTFNGQSGALSGPLVWFGEQGAAQAPLSGPWPSAGLQSTARGGVIASATAGDYQLTLDPQTAAAGSLLANGKFIPAPGGPAGLSASLSNRSDLFTAKIVVNRHILKNATGVFLPSEAKVLGFTLENSASVPMHLTGVP